MKKHIQIIFGRVLYIALFVTLQVAALVMMFGFFRDKFSYFYLLCAIITVLAVAHILNGNSNPAYKIAWLIPIMLLPIFGGLLYLMFGFSRHGHRLRHMASFIGAEASAAMELVPNAAQTLAQSAPEAALQSRYLSGAAHCHPYDHTAVTYYPLGDDFFPAMCQALERAEKYIFLEYFIVEEGVMWNTILEILERKAASGVDVRVMYDDLGCLFTLPRKYDRQLQKRGLRATAFNRFNTILSPRFNNRDHRKICVVDGVTAFTGGVNLADEYINAIVKHGHWKDTAIGLHGAAAWSLTVQFLALWDLTTGEKEAFVPFAPPAAQLAQTPSDGYVQPYSDIPMDDELVGETVYLNMIHRAKRYVYITTPYLIVDNETVTALQMAAKSGVDVRIITPHVPDKKIVFFLTRSYYKPLLDAGVKIFEYTPGFIHAKTMVCDDEYAVVGTINLDYRSLYLHLECAAWLYGCGAVDAVKRDFLHTEQQSQQMQESPLGRMTAVKKLWLAVLRTFAPLM
ncbi:MAG: cardiolipin synthase [Oscillospiraceae bacterium]|nr:cardiolipin synthase [Oscillospiraceae bacterium]